MGEIPQIVEKSCSYDQWAVISWDQAATNLPVKLLKWMSETAPKNSPILSSWLSWALSFWATPVWSLWRFDAKIRRPLKRETVLQRALLWNSGRNTVKPEFFNNSWCQMCHKNSAKWLPFRQKCSLRVRGATIMNHLWNKHHLRRGQHFEKMI